MGECMNVTIQTGAKPAAKQATLADLMAPPRAALAMPKQVLTAPPGSFMQSVRSLLWAVAPGLRRLG